MDFFQLLREGLHEQVEAAITANPDVINQKDQRGFTPLILACYNDNLGLARLLLDRGANVDAVDAKGNTALMGVVFKQNLPS
ncbi:MAG: ankyrin repeat domain-containing protein [Bacteroidota bacterium]